MSSLPAPLLDELRRAAGIDAVRTDGETLTAHEGDRWFARARPGVVVFPRSTAAVAGVLRAACRAGIPVTPRGAGQGYVGGCVPAPGGIALSLERMNRIKEISPEDFVAVVEPGVITGRLQQQARSLGLLYPPDPASLKECSLGGNIATNAGGPRCLKYGVTRHYVLGLEVVLASGEVLRLGGRCHKNKTGFDLAGLFVGSEGMLGVVTEATLRLLPLPPARAVLSAGFATMPAAAAAVQAVFRGGFLPAAVEIADRFTLEAAREYSRSAAIPPGGAHLLVEVDGQPGGVAADAEALEALLRLHGALTVEVAQTEEACEALWELRRLFSTSLKSTGLRKLNEDVVVPRGRLVELVEFAAELGREAGFPVACFGHAGDGNIHVNIMVADPEAPGMAGRMEQALDRLFTGVLAMDGAITGEHGVGLAKKRWWPEAVSPSVQAAHRAVKAALDPAGILNPGKFLTEG